MSQEEKDRAVQHVRGENRRTADRIEQGTAYHEPVTVWFTDKKQHTVEVYAMSSKQFREAARKAGLTSFSELVDEKGEIRREKLMQSLDFVAAIAEAASHDDSITDKLLTSNDDGKIADKAFDLMKTPKN